MLIAVSLLDVSSNHDQDHLLSHTSFSIRNISFSNHTSHGSLRDMLTKTRALSLELSGVPVEIAYMDRQGPDVAIIYLHAAAPLTLPTIDFRLTISSLGTATRSLPNKYFRT